MSADTEASDGGIMRERLVAPGDPMKSTRSADTEAVGGGIMSAGLVAVPEPLGRGPGIPPSGRKINYRMAKTHLRSLWVTWDDNGQPLLDGEPMYVKVPVNDGDVTP